MDSADSSEDTEQLCSSTIELIRSLQQILLNKSKSSDHSKSQPQPQPQPQCQCSSIYAEHVQPQVPLVVMPEPPQLHPATCSNVSNLSSSQTVSSVVTSPSEIRLLLRLESWIGEKGVLVVRPSVHHQAQADTASTNSSAAVNSSATSKMPVRPPPPCSSDTAEDVLAGGDLYEEPTGALDGDGACDCAGGERDLLVQLQQQHQLLRSLGRRQQAPSKNSASAPAAPATSAKSRGQPQPPPLPQAQPQLAPLGHRRERGLVKRPALPGAGTAASLKAAAGAGSGVRGGQRRVEASEPERGDTMELMRKLHRLLGAELKQ